MKKITITLFFALFLINVHAQTFISDKQCSIGKGKTNIIEYPPADRTIIIDSLGGKATIELLDGRRITRLISFVNETYENYGKLYPGHYKTNREEKIYIRDYEIGFHAMASMDVFITYELKGKQQPTKEEEEEEAFKRTYENLLTMYGSHDAACFKAKRIEKGIRIFTVHDILGKPIFEETFLVDDDEYISIEVYKQYVIRYKDLSVDKVISIE